MPVWLQRTPTEWNRILDAPNKGAIYTDRFVLFENAHLKKTKKEHLNEDTFN